MTKTCSVCGKVIQCDDWYKFIRLKYCPECRKMMRRIQERNRLQALREKRREANALTRELCASQQREIELLRAELIRQRERNAALERIARKEEDP